MPHIHVKHSGADRVFNTDQIVTVLYSIERVEFMGGGNEDRPSVVVTTTIPDYEFILTGDNADEFWCKYQRLCVASQRPEVG